MACVMDTAKDWKKYTSYDVIMTVSRELLTIVV